MWKMLDDLAVTDSAAYAEMAKAGAEALVSIPKFEVVEFGDHLVFALTATCIVRWVAKQKMSFLVERLTASRASIAGRASKSPNCLFIVLLFVLQTPEPNLHNTCTHQLPDLVDFAPSTSVSRPGYVSGLNSDSWHKKHTGGVEGSSQVLQFAVNSKAPHIHTK